MPDSTIQQIKERLDIVNLVSSYIKLQKTGINYRAVCPFHSEKKPSFFVSPARQMFRCFGCGASGSIFDFVMKIEGVEFGDALRILAKRAGVELPTFHPELKTKRQRLYEICDLSCRFFEKHLEKSSAGKKVKEYLLKRGIKEETIKKWRLGYSPETWQGLSDFLVGRGYLREEIVQAGLAVKSEKSQTPYDRFRNRIMFPVFDLNSQVIGFGGRITESPKSDEEAIAKYINTSNTLLYDKSRVLYGLNFARMDIRKKDSCILTEGYTDVILSHQEGFTNTVASSGTALTAYQLGILKRYTSNLLTAFDMDFAGDVATKRGIELAQELDFEVKVISMSQEKDPADIILENPKEWEKAIEKSQEIMGFYFESALAKCDKNSPQGKKEIAALLLPSIKKIPNRILQSHWLQKLANLLKVSEETVVEELKKVAGKEPPVFENAAPYGESGEKKQAKQRWQLLEEKIFSLVLKEPKGLDCIEENFFDCFSSQAKIVLAACQKEKLSDKEDMAKFFVKLQKKREELKDILESGFFRAEIEEIEKPLQEIKLCLAELKSLKVKNRLEELAQEIQVAEEKRDEAKVLDLMQQFNQLAKINPVK